MDVLLTECRSPVSLRAPDPALSVALTALIADLPDDVFYLTTSSANRASQRLAQAAGFALIRVFKRARHTERHGVQDTYLYRLKRGVGAEVDRGQKKARGRAGKP